MHARFIIGRILMQRAPLNIIIDRQTVLKL
jgi:hypothetical protein